jgi:hypothetical protein
MNEFRNAMNDQARTIEKRFNEVLPRGEHDVMQKAMQDQIDDLRRRNSIVMEVQAEARGKASQAQVWGAWIGILVSLGVGLAAILR